MIIWFDRRPKFHIFTGFKGDGSKVLVGNGVHNNFDGSGYDVVTGFNPLEGENETSIWFSGGKIKTLRRGKEQFFIRRSAFPTQVEKIQHGDHT